MLLLLGLGLLTLTAQTPKLKSLEQTLRESRWQKRVLLVAAPNATQVDFRQQQALLAAAKTQLNNRDFMVVNLFYDQLTAADQQFLAQKTSIRPPTFAVVLIGKDGDVKEKSTQVITPAALFSIVDKMPMRRKEIQRPTIK